MRKLYISCACVDTSQRPYEEPFLRNGSRTEVNPFRNIQLEFFTGSEHMIRYKRHDHPLWITKPARYNRYFVMSRIRFNRHISIHVKVDFCRD